MDLDTQIINKGANHEKTHYLVARSAHVKCHSFCYRLLGAHSPIGLASRFWNDLAMVTLSACRRRGATVCRARIQAMRGEITLARLIVILMLFLAACAPMSNTLPANSTPNPVQAYVDANTNQATAVAAIATAQFYTGQLTATVEASNLESTAQAQDMEATQQAVNIAGTQQTWSASATADSAQATTAASATSSAVAVQAAWTKPRSASHPRPIPLLSKRMQPSNTTDRKNRKCKSNEIEV